MITPDENQTIRKLIASRQPGHSLPRAFYCDELIFRADVERIWRRGWLFAGSCGVTRSTLVDSIPYPD